MTPRPTPDTLARRFAECDALIALCQAEKASLARQAKTAGMARGALQILARRDAPPEQRHAALRERLSAWLGEAP